MPANPPKPDRWPVSRWYSEAPTVGDMHDLGWSVFSVCDGCGVRLGVNLKALIEKRGRGYSLWNIRPECRRVLPQPFFCVGFLYFRTQPPGGALEITLWVEEDLLKTEHKPRRVSDCGWL